MTTDARFLQIHTLTPYIGVLLNRDDVGQAKRLTLGGTTRGRVSSQSLKRHWRRATGEWSLGSRAEMAVRSRQTFVKCVAEPLVGEGLDADQVHAAIVEVQKVLLGESKKAQQKKLANPSEDLETNQVIVLGPAEIAYVKDLVRSAVAGAGDPVEARKAAEVLVKQQKPNFATMREGAGLDAALFGRMITGDILARVDAAVHVAHAITVHAVETEPDYFTAVDDLVQEAGEQGSGHINVTELTSGLYYSYVVVDLPLLVANLEGCEAANWLGADRTLAGQVVERLVGVVATVSPGAKLGSTAPYGYADTVLIEAGSRQPRSLANAFYSAVKARFDLREEGSRRLLDQLARLDRMYGPGEARRLATLIDALGSGAPESLPLSALTAWAGGVAAGTAALDPSA